MTKDIAQELTSRPKMSVIKAISRAPSEPGYYSIFLRKVVTFPPELRDGLSNTSPIYIGIATKSLATRLCDQELRDQGNGTFFRSIGAIMGFTPPKGSLVGKKNQNNYRFSKTDSMLIEKWIMTNVTVTWFTTSPNKEVEKELIRAYQPVLNFTNNPNPSLVLQGMRKNCRQIAASNSA